MFYEEEAVYETPGIRYYCPFFFTPLLTGCGGTDKHNKEKDQSEFVFIPEYIKLPDEIAEVKAPVLIGNTVYLLRKTPASEMTQRTILTFAANGISNYMRKAILEFNRRDPDYCIKLIDYSFYNTADDKNAGITKLNTQIMSGNIPDIIQTRDLPYHIYASKGLFEDLYPNLDRDTKPGGRTAILPALRKAFETDGKLYRIAIPERAEMNRFYYMVLHYAHDTIVFLDSFGSRFCYKAYMIDSLL